MRERREAAAGQPVLPPSENRAQFDESAEPLPDDVLVQMVDAGGVPAAWLDVPGVAADRVLFYLHGGGYEVGSIRSHGHLVARIGRASGMRVFFVEYRRAPEHPFPAAFDDAKTAWHWLMADGSGRQASLAIAGDSAGGGLAAALMVSLHEAHEPLPVAAVLMSPWTNLSGSGASMTEKIADDPVLTPASINQSARDYLAGADPRDPRASPLFASMAGLPPMLVLVGSAELLLSDSADLARLAAEEGVQVTLDIGEGLPHAYPGNAPNTPEAADAIRQIGQFLRSWVPA